MSDIMKSIPFGQLMEWILAEHKATGQVFGIQKAYVADPARTVEIFGRKLENPVGPAAGPHTQLAQNLVAAYYAGARFFELKTVQKMDGPELSACIPKPCIVAEDEAYNCEWSTELYVPQAMGEYIKGWMALHVISKEFGLGSPDGFQFNMSCGYNLEGIKDKKIDDFIEGLKDARDTEVFKECKTWLLDHADLFEHVTKEDIEAIPSEICNSITLSTMHGCPPQEIENIVMYLLKEKHINTYVKCNPTLLGYEFVRKAMDDLGYDYMAFTDFHFKDDLQYEDAVPMLKRLKETAAQEGLSFGVKTDQYLPGRYQTARNFRVRRCICLVKPCSRFLSQWRHVLQNLLTASFQCPFQAELTRRISIRSWAAVFGRSQWQLFFSNRVDTNG